MKVSQLIEILSNDLKEHGDRDVYLLTGNCAHSFTYLGPGISDFGEYFWLTCDSEISCEEDEKEEDYKAPNYTPHLKVVK